MASQGSSQPRLASHVSRLPRQWLAKSLAIQVLLAEAMASHVSSLPKQWLAKSLASQGWLAKAIASQDCCKPRLAGQGYG